MISLLSDIFWVAMAVTIMFGLAFGTLPTVLSKVREFKFEVQQMV